MSARRVVITGLGPITPIGCGAEPFWTALLEGRSGIQPIAAFDASGFDSRIGGEISQIKNVNDFVTKPYRKAGKIMARDIELAVAAAHFALMDAGLKTKCILERGDAPGPSNIDSARFGANIGAGLICADLPELAGALASAAPEGTFDIKLWGVPEVEGGRTRMENLTPLWLLKFLPNMLACHVTIVHDAQGPSNTITCGEASSHLAIGEAFRTIARGVADVCICGGAESKANPMALVRQSLGQRLSKRNDDPARACRPFASDRDGTATSEGGGLVILEELEHAKARGARIYAELVGFGASNDASSVGFPTKPHPEGRGVATAIRKALRDAKINASDIDLIVPMACGTREHDASEARGLAAAFGSHLPSASVMAINGGVGNNGAGTGAIDFIAAALAIKNQTLAPSINAEPIDPSWNLNIKTRGPTDRRVNYAITTAYALGGGQNAALALKAWRE
ncbi:MAG: beta-ketoacyl-[acyl-carrier-protein] synthase family protein [Phycisphaerae bacterium]|nr:beta-ketoacyl-[acyl-carrier-protein] synthase family protein [Phycisphaerae bacterium]